MRRAALRWFGFSGADYRGHGHGHGHDHARGSAHAHTHGVIDPTIATTARGIWAIKWSFVILGITALLQLVVAFFSSSVALLADAIHNVGDAATAVPLWIAFLLARRKPSRRFTYGLGRAEDLAGVVIVLIILFSAIVAGYQAIDRLIHPQPIEHLGWVALAGVLGFAGNEAVAVFRIRVGRQISSAALIADGYHARTDGLTSLAVVLGAAGVWAGFPLADPIVGLLITIAILGIVWQSARAVFTRMLDGVDPEVLAEIRHAAGHVAGIRQVTDLRARWLGHRLHAEVEIALDPATTVAASDVLMRQLEHELRGHLPALGAARIRVRPFAGHELKGELAEGVLAIVDTPEGERMRFTATRAAEGLQAWAKIRRGGGRVETLELTRTAADAACLQSATAPEEPHEFDAQLMLAAGGRREALPFRMEEAARPPHGHHVH